MFVITQSTSYSWPVKVEVPTDGGKFETQTFDATFKRISRTRIEQMQKDAEAGSMVDVELAKEILVGWSGITDATGEQVPFSESMRDRLLDIPGVCAVIVRSFFESLAGAKRKN